MMSTYDIMCTKEDISLALIEERASQQLSAGNVPTLIFISDDLYAILIKQTYSSQKYAFPGSPSGNAIMSVHTSAGQLHFQRVNKLKHFLLVGRKEDMDAITMNGVDPIFWNDQEVDRINKALEETLLKDES
jgi:hypothetical protein